MTEITITLRESPSANYGTVTDVYVLVGRRGEPPKTRWVASLPGIEVDYLDTLVSECTRAYMYGETPGDVVKAAAAVHHLAKRHRVAHEF